MPQKDMAPMMGTQDPAMMGQTAAMGNTMSAEGSLSPFGDPANAGLNPFGPHNEGLSQDHATDAPGRSSPGQDPAMNGPDMSGAPMGDPAMNAPGADDDGTGRSDDGSMTSGSSDMTGGNGPMNGPMTDEMPQGMSGDGMEMNMPQDGSHAPEDMMGGQDSGLHGDTPHDVQNDGPSNFGPSNFAPGPLQGGASLSHGAPIDQMSPNMMNQPHNTGNPY